MCEWFVSNILLIIKFMFDRCVNKTSEARPVASSSSSSESSSLSSTSPASSSSSDSRLCKICYTDEMGVVFLPCGHLVACVKCALSLTTCAVCRQPVTATVRAFLSWTSVIHWKTWIPSSQILFFLKCVVQVEPTNLRYDVYEYGFNKYIHTCILLFCEMQNCLKDFI